jgi:hypothetical protein
VTLSESNKLRRLKSHCLAFKQAWQDPAVPARVDSLLFACLTVATITSHVHWKVELESEIKERGVGALEESQGGEEGM